MDSLFGVRLLLFFFQNLSRPISMQQLLKVTDLLFQLAASFGIYHSLTLSRNLTDNGIRMYVYLFFRITSSVEVNVS